MSWKRGLAFFFLLAVLAAFPYGPLFAWSPVHPGYTKLNFKRADVLYPSDRPPDPAYSDVDRYVALAESFHNLRCSKKITVVACRNWNDCLRFAAPFLGNQRPVGVTIPTGTVIFLTPYIYGTLDVGGVLRHELSHATLNQNRTLLSVWRLLKQPWFSEGVAGVVAGMDATAPGHQLVALPALDFIAAARHQDLWPSFDAVQQKNWRFSYTAWEFFWVRQIQLGGKEAFLKFEGACTSEPEKCRADFATIYGMDLRQAVEVDQDDLRSGRFVPVD
ncbi:MAG TPA: hypothetical protein VMH05_10065 [Bryobacteraceae bacterium]|nr:hypothetical protein [Bryobacteraceae bacterium]